MRLIAVRRGCATCREWIGIVNRINMRLPYERRIEVIDNYLWEELRISLFPILDRFDESLFNSYPLVFIDGRIVTDGIKEIIKPYLKGFFKGEFVGQ